MLQSCQGSEINWWEMEVSGRRPRGVGVCGGVSPPYMGIGSVVASGKGALFENFCKKNCQNSAFLWHLRKFCWPFYVLLYVVITDMLSMDVDDMFSKPRHSVRRSQEICGRYS